MVRRDATRAGLGPADWVTAVRALLVAALAVALARPRLPATLPVIAVAAVATALDGMDGWIARRTGTSSAFGARFDMETDAVLILVLSAFAWRYDRAGAWVILSGLLRYLFVAAAAVWPWLARPLEPSRRRQWLCVLQIAALLVALAVEPPLSAGVAAAALAALTGSFLADILWLWRWQASRPRS
jgi:phosphatidylglycerophosphate synthase